MVVVWHHWVRTLLQWPVGRMDVDEVGRGTQVGDTNPRVAALFDVTQIPPHSGSLL
jgi:hypothetical protein